MHRCIVSLARLLLVNRDSTCKLSNSVTQHDYRLALCKPRQRFLNLCSRASVTQLLTSLSAIARRTAWTQCLSLTAVRKAKNFFADLMRSARNIRRWLSCGSFSINLDAANFLLSISISDRSTLVLVKLECLPLRLPRRWV